MNVSVPCKIVSKIIIYYFYFFFFKQKTAYEIYQCDWSSDVCSSDLAGHMVGPPDHPLQPAPRHGVAGQDIEIGAAGGDHDR